jgi:opacity protein-like surface antigen
MKNFKKPDVAFLIALSFISCISSAATPQHVMNKNSWFVGAGAGNSWLDLTKSTTTVPNGSSFPSPFDVDSFTVNNPSSQAQAQLNLGYRWHEDRKFIPYYSLFGQYRHYFNTNIRGSVDQYSLPEFENYNYRLKYKADLFTINGKINLIEYKKILPYLSAGVGVIYNHFNYNETATDNVTPRISPDYSGNSSSTVLTLGAGIDYKLTDNVWATLGYEYVAQSALKSSNGGGSWSTTSLNFGHASMNTLFLNISANIPDALPAVFRS